MKHGATMYFRMETVGKREARSPIAAYLLPGTFNISTRAGAPWAIRVPV